MPERCLWCKSVGVFVCIFVIGRSLFFVRLIFFSSSSSSRFFRFVFIFRFLLAICEYMIWNSFIVLNQQQTQCKISNFRHEGDNKFDFSECQCHICVEYKWTLLFSLLRVSYFVLNVLLWLLLLLFFFVLRVSNMIWFYKISELLEQIQIECGTKW